MGREQRPGWESKRPASFEDTLHFPNSLTEHAPLIVATLEDLKNSRAIAREKGWEMYANDLGDQIDGMEKVLSELEVPTEKRGENRGGQ
jgi:hypothetical protein